LFIRESLEAGGVAPPGRPFCDPHDGRAAYRFVWCRRPLKRILQMPIVMTPIAQIGAF
jgi:hypothetical protein